MSTCPGLQALKVTDLLQRASSSKKFFSLPRDNPEKIAEKSLKAMMKGKRMYIGKFYYKLYRFLSKVLPNDLAISLSKL